MPLSRSRDYLSIGEVLETIRPDFPDISISKIRFLEAEGLIRPERTNSGYRKFYEDDVKRLRFILALQRDHFLPLKVIRERLLDFESNGDETPAAIGGAAGNGHTEQTSALTDVNLTREELKKAAGLNEEQLKGLEDFGILDGGRSSYDGDALAAAKAAKGLFDLGVEARHLRMYRQLADREATFIQQLVAPAVKRSERSTKTDAARSTNTVFRLSRTLREALVRSSIREQL